MDLSAASDVQVVELFKAVEEADKLRAAGSAGAAKQKLKSTVDAAVGWGEPEADAIVDGEETEVPEEPKVPEGKWVSLLTVGTVSVGEEVDLTKRKFVHLGGWVIFEHGPRHGIAFRADEKLEREKKLRDLRIAGSGHPSVRFEGEKDIYFDPDRTPKAPVADGLPTFVAGEDDDVRVLPVHFERDGRRHRRLEDAQPDYSEEPFEDWPILGDRSMANSCRDMRRSNATYLTHHDNWVSKSGVSKRDRSVNEHSVLRQALHWLGTYDQLNLPNIAGAEALDLRRQLIEKAHEASPDVPSYEGADDFLGFQENPTGALIDPRRVAFWASRMQAKAKVLEQARKSREERNAQLRQPNAKSKAKADRLKADKDAGQGGADP